jgi:hypothetical protein
MLRELLDLERRVFGLEHFDTLTTTSFLALSLSRQGKDAAATQMLRELLDVQRRVFGPEHPGTLTTMGNLSLSLSSQRKYAEAEQVLRGLLDVQRRVLGPEHPDALATARRLATALRHERSFASLGGALWNWTCSIVTALWRSFARALPVWRRAFKGWGAAVEPQASVKLGCAFAHLEGPPPKRGNR